MGESGKMSLNKADWKAGLKAAVVWSAPMLLLYVNSVLGAIQQANHAFAWGDLVPSTFTWGAIVGWALMQVQGMLLRLVRGK